MKQEHWGSMGMRDQDNETVYVEIDSESQKDSIGK